VKDESSERKVVEGRERLSQTLASAYHAMKACCPPIAAFDPTSHTTADSDAGLRCQELFALGFSLHQGGQLPEAAAIYQQVLELQPGHFDSWHLLGLIALQANNSQLAVDFINHAIAIKPDYLAAYYNLGIALQASSQLDAAIASYDKAIAIKPDYAEAYLNRGSALNDLKQLDAAVASFERAIAIKPDYAAAYYNRGNSLKELKQLDVAIASYDKAIAIKPDYTEAYFNRGGALQALGHLGAAIASYDNAIALNPDHVEAYLNKSLALLLQGDFEQGWPLFEWRWQSASVPVSRKRNFAQPLWLGDNSLEGKTILLHSEQGWGDTIQFCRYARWVADLGANVVLEVEQPIAPLLKGLDGVNDLVEKGKPLPSFDCHCPLMSLPLAFKTRLNTIPRPVRYLSPTQDKLAYWNRRLGEKQKPFVGLVWGGRTTHYNDHNRSIPLNLILPHLAEGVQYISLKKELLDADRAALQQSSIRHFGDELNDFGDTAALCDLMDVVISVDTSAAHLAGAMGKPTWILLPYVAEWRWLLGREDSPWYPTAKLYRQTRMGDWDSVLRRVKADVVAFTAVHR